MRRVGQVRRRDANEKAIRKALEAAGAKVTLISGEGAPDILVEFRDDLHAFEIKSKTGARTAAQNKTRWPIVRTEYEALLAIGAL